MTGQKVKDLVLIDCEFEMYLEKSHGLDIGIVNLTPRKFVFRYSRLLGTQTHS